MLVGLDLIVVLVLIAVFVNYYLKNGRVIYSLLAKYPGPPAIPYIGNIFEFRSTKSILPVLEKYQAKYGSVFQLWAGIITPIQYVICLADAKSAEAILGSQIVIEKSFTYKFMYNWLATGLLTSGGKKWKQRRRIITPTFHFQILEQFIDVFNAEGEVLVKKLRKELGKDSTDIYPYITFCTLDIICESAMGTTVNAQEQSDSEYVYSVKEVCRIISERSMTLPKLYDFLYIFSRDYYKEKTAVKLLHDYTDKVILARKKGLEENQNVAVDEDTGIKRRLAFLDLLLHSTIDGKPLKHEEIREEVDTFMFEGHDTTASAISFTLFCLANNPSTQKRALEELEQIFDGDKKRAATYRDLQDMKYLELIIKESLRLYPSVPMYGRCINEEFQYGDTVLPKGLTIIIIAHLIHRDPKIYPDPEKFDPDRFLPENCKDRSPYAYVPFSAGPRNCIGQKFAMLEMKATVSKILRNYELLPSIPEHKLCLIPELVLKSSNGIKIRLKERNIM